MRRKIILPDRRGIEQIDYTDPLPYYYQPGLSWIFRRRLEIGLEMLEAKAYPRILEIGFGSGVLFKTLAGLSEEMHGVDIHPKIPTVEAMLKSEGLRASLKRGDIRKLDYPDDFFDAVLCFSTLEHIEDTDQALTEISRVLKPGGTAILGFPPVNRAMSFLFHSLGADDIDDRHVSGVKKILASCRKTMVLEQVRCLPGFLPTATALYVVCKCGKIMP